MASIEENIKYENKQHFKFSYGTAIEIKDEYFDKCGTILCKLLRPKLKETFEDMLAILYRLKPIRDIDDYMLKFNFDRNVALKHNTDLALMLQFWFDDTTSLMSMAKESLSSVTKLELLVNSVERQESDFRGVINKTVNQFQTREMTLTEGGSELSIPIFLGSHTSADEKESDSLPENEPKSEVMIVMKVRDELKNFTLTKALEVIKEERVSCERNFEAAEALRCSIDVLIAISVSNRYEISHWQINTDLIKKRSDLWANRQKQQTGQL